MEMEIAKAIRCGTVICVLNQKISTSSSSSVAATAVTAATLMMKMEIEIETQTDENGAEQRVKQRVNRQFIHIYITSPQNSNTNQRTGLLPSSSN